MKHIFLALMCAGWLAPGSALAGSADKHSGDAFASEERLLGAADDEARHRALLPFTREIALASVVTDSLDAAMAEAGVPSVVRLEARQALGTASDREDLALPGDRFQLRYDQSFTIHGDEVGVGRLSRIELRTCDKGTIGVQRFHAAGRGEALWLTSGQAAAPAVMRLPLDTIAISSRFGLRADPFEQLKPVAGRGPVVTNATGCAASMTVNVATKRGVLAGLSPTGTTSRAAGRASPVWYMHEGVDLVAPIGTPVHAAGDGVIAAMGPNGGYGNWVRIEHSGNLSTWKSFAAWSHAPGCNAIGKRRRRHQRLSRPDRHPCPGKESAETIVPGTRMIRLLQTFAAAWYQTWRHALQSCKAACPARGQRRDFVVGSAGRSTPESRWRAPAGRSDGRLR